MKQKGGFVVSAAHMNTRPRLLPNGILAGLLLALLLTAPLFVAIMLDVESGNAPQHIAAQATNTSQP